MASEAELAAAAQAAEEHKADINQLSPKEQQLKVWSKVQTTTASADHVHDPRTWPSYDKVLSHLGEADYTNTLRCPFDGLSPPNDKTLCPYGVVCCMEMEIFDNVPYSGLLEPGKTAGILRLSSAMKPPSLGVKSTLGRALLYATGHKIRKAKLFPCAALKIFRSNVHSGNLLLGGSKVGQREADFFAHCVCTTMTEQMPRAVKPLVRKFWTYSDYPLSLGVSDFCRYSVSGEAVPDDHLAFPFAVVLRPCIGNPSNDNATASGDFEDSFDGFLDHTLVVEMGTVLYDIFVCPEPADVPDSSKLQRIGRITTTSPMLPSSSKDGLFFRHQKKEEDYLMRPSWPQSLSAQVTINDGQRTGTIGTLAGWKLFEQHIDEGSYVDFGKQD